MKNNEQVLEELKAFREEVELSKRERQKRERTKRILTTMKAFIDNEGTITDEQLASTLALMGITTSSSTVGRDLTINLEKVFKEENAKKSIEEGRIIDELTDEQISIIAFIKKKRKDNKKEGLSKGGTISSRRNDIEKNEDGKFNGCRKRN